MPKYLVIRVISNLSCTKQVILYQDIEINVKNYLIGAWEHPLIHPKAQYDAVLPVQTSICAASSIGVPKTYTRQLDVECNTAWEICEDNNTLDIRASDDPSSSMDAIEITNKCLVTKFAVVTKDSKPLFACMMRPEFRVSFAIRPRLYVALSDLEIHEEFFDAATVSRPTIIDYDGQDYLTIHLDENVSTGFVSINYDFKKFV